MAISPPKITCLPRHSPRRERSGVGQLTLVEHSLCPLDSGAGLVGNLVHESSFYFMDRRRHYRQGRARVYSPSGLSATDEFFLWGLLALTFAQPQLDANLRATPHYCLRQLGVIDAQERRGGQQYRQFGQALERLSQVTYLNDHFFDPVRGEHRKISFGFLSYSLPIDPESSRAWRIAWDPIFFDAIRASGGSFRFDLDVYRQLDPASRRLFLLLSKIFCRRASSPRFELRHLAVDVLGFSPSVATRDLKIKVRRCIDRLVEQQIVRSADRGEQFQSSKRGEYHLVLERGDFFRKVPTHQSPPIEETALDEILHRIGFDGPGIRRLQARYGAPLIHEWADITLAAKERFGEKFFKKCPQAHLIDNLKNAARGQRTPPDWWRELRKAEAKTRAGQASEAPLTSIEVPNLPGEARQAFEQTAREIFAIFRAAGQPVGVARSNALRFAKERVQQSKHHPNPDSNGSTTSQKQN